MVSSNSFPQSGDNDYAENFRAWVGRSNITDYVETGMDFTVDYTVPEITISGGKALVSRDKEVISGNDEERLVVDMAVHVPAATKSLSSGAINHIYVTPNWDSNDSAQFSIYESESDAEATELKIGEVDTSTDTKTTINRSPDVEVEEFRAHVDLGIPVYDNLSNALGGEGNLVYITGDGDDEQGVYRHDGTSFGSVGPKALAEVPDITGVTALIEDESSNRPSAGTDGRIFLASDTKNIYFDDGSSWLLLGTNPGNIGADDLGFDVATQSELDSHEATGDAHHSKTVTLDELNDSDVTEFIIDTSGDRPSAGTNRRVFIERDTGRVLYDNGSSWIVIGISDHSQLDGVDTDDHHTRYADSEAVDAIESANGLTFTGSLDVGSNTIILGSSDEITLSFDSTSSDVVITDEDSSATRMALDQSSGDHRITGTYSEGSAL